MSVLDDVEWGQVRDHYMIRKQIHGKLLSLHKKQQVKAFAELLLGVSNPGGNYSAAEHKLGPQILCENPNAHQRVFDLATKFMALTTAGDVPQLIKQAGMRFLQIGVGSEASCMVKPDVCWVANTRTIWTYLVLKPGGNTRRADEELKLYRDADQSSEMAYRQWAGLHRELGPSMTKLSEEGERRAKSDSVQPGRLKFLWADAIATWLYEWRYD